MSRLFAGLMLALVLGLTAVPAWASCATHTYVLQGRMTTCTTCCYFGNNCSTTCF